MKKSFTRALKDLHKSESGPDADVIALPAATAFPVGNAWQHVPPQVRSDGFLKAKLPNPTSLSTVGLRLFPDETDCDGYTPQTMFAPLIRPIPEKVAANFDVRSKPIVETENRCDGREDVLDEAALLEAPIRRQPSAANHEPVPSPTALPLATAFEEEVCDRLRQSTHLAQFKDLARQFTKGFSPGFAATIAVAHLDEMQHALQVIASVARVLGMNKEIKTLLVDTDTDHKTLSKCFDVGRREGFGEACDRIRLWPHLIHPTATPDVSILPAGNCVDRTGPGFDRVRRLLSALSSDEYSLVLINAGEIVNPLTRHVCKAADSSHLLMRLGRTERAYAAQAIHTSGIRFEGIIVTTVPQGRIA